ncbi:hypothetical protein ACFL9T_17855 [Thermodesulfobacteriota bacterium]
MKDKTLHPDEDQILRSLVDDHGLPEKTRKHLEDCEACRHLRSSFQSELEFMGKMAGECTPAPLKKPVLPEPKPDRQQKYRLPVFAFGFAAAALVAVLSVFILFSDFSRELGTDLAVKSEVRMHLLEDILNESELSENYLDITSTDVSYFDDEFLEFVIPLEDEPDTARNFLRGYQA